MIKWKISNKKANSNFQFLILLPVQIIILFTFTACATSQNFTITEGILYNRIQFASKDDGILLLARKDDFLKKFSSFDSTARFGTSELPDFEKRKEIFKKAVIKWTEFEMNKMNKALYLINSKMKNMKLPFPEEIILIRTNGKDESNAPYTRMNCIIVPNSLIQKNMEDLEEIIIHEMFHIISRYNAELKNELYKIIGFHKCKELIFPEDSKDLKLTNPDAPLLNHYIELPYYDDTLAFVPITYAKTKFDKQQPNFFKYVKARLIAVKVNRKETVPIMEKGDTIIINQYEYEPFFDKVGKNTRYIIHPEEIIADNFVLMIKNVQFLQSPDIVEKMREVFAKYID